MRGGDPADTNVSGLGLEEVRALDQLQCPPLIIFKAITLLVVPDFPQALDVLVFPSEIDLGGMEVLVVRLVPDGAAYGAQSGDCE